MDGIKRLRGVDALESVEVGDSLHGRRCHDQVIERVRKQGVPTKETPWNSEMQSKRF